MMMIQSLGNAMYSWMMGNSMQSHAEFKSLAKDAFASKKRLAKEYEQLAIWSGDTDFEYGHGLSRTFLPFSSRTYVESENLQGQDALETEWELL